MMTLDELLHPNNKPETIQKVSDSLLELAEKMVGDGDTDLVKLATMAAAAGLLGAFSRRQKEEAAQPAAAGGDNLTLLDM